MHGSTLRTQPTPATRANIGTMPERLLVLDGDYGVDDSIAALYLAAEPNVRILAVGSVHGNTYAATAARNALTVLDVAGLPDVPVAVGAGRPLAQPVSVAPHVHGADGLGGAAPPDPPPRQPVATPAAVQLIEVIRAHPGRCTVVATGPLTNLAIALLLAPDLPDLVQHVVLMGGTLRAPGNVGAYAEANFAHDPEAADLVVQAGWPVTVTGLDVTMQTWLAPADLDRLRASEAPAARFASRVLPHYLAFYRESAGRDGCPLHDETAARLAVEPDLATYEEGRAEVVLHDSEQRGRLRLTPGPGRVRVALAADRDAIVGPLVDRLVASR